MSCSRNFTAVVGVTYIFCRNAVLSQRMIPVLDGTIEGVDKTAADHADTFVPVVINFYKFPVCKFSGFVVFFILCGDCQTECLGTLFIFFFRLIYILRFGPNILIRRKQLPRRRIYDV